MKDHSKTAKPQSRVKKRSNVLLYAFIGSVLLFVIIFYLYTEKKIINVDFNKSDYITEAAENGPVTARSTLKPSEPLEKTPVESSLSLAQVYALVKTAVKGLTEKEGAKPGSTTSTSGTKNRQAQEPAVNHSPLMQNSKSSQANILTDEAEIIAASTANILTDEAGVIAASTANTTNTTTNTTTTTNTITTTANTPELLVKRLNDFYEHLDRQSYMKDFRLEEPSKTHFSKLLQKLIDTPPVVTHETDDLFTILKNTAHMFRILGRKNILILKGILDREKTSFEDILKTFFQLTDYPDTLLQEYNLTIPKDALYDYAGFFLNTMGGRLYLFRRDSASRMTVSYFAILIIDRANNEFNNRHGIDIRPAIDSLIDEIENTARPLTLKEEYLDTLYDFKEKYD